MVIHALTQNFSADVSLIKTSSLAVKAFFMALPFATQNFQHTEQRDFIMSKLFEAMTIQDEETRVVAMQTLVEIGR